MLVFYVAIAILGSFLLEVLLHKFSRNYEIVWVKAPEKSGLDIAREIAGALRKNQARI